MKNYIVKNYKGNLLESLKNFSNKYKGMRITEAAVEDGSLRITAEAKTFSVDLECLFNDPNETIETVKEKAEEAAAKHNVAIVGVKGVDYSYADAIVSVDAKDEKSLREFVRDFYYNGECTEQEIDDVLDESKNELAKEGKGGSQLLIVINAYYGGFEIPKKFTSETGVENNGYAIANPVAPNVKCAGYVYRTEVEPDGDLDTRCDPRFVEWVSNNSRAAKTLKIVAVPANATDIMINEYDGDETVLYVKDGHVSYAKAI